MIGLVRRSAQALGVATEIWLRDYFRIRPAMARTAIAALVEAGELIPVTVRAGRARPAYLWHEARCARAGSSTRALLSPFDSMVFERSRLEQLFDFTYRIEIYVPEPQRIYGYYVYPFLLGEALRRPGRPQGRPGPRRAAGQLGLAGARAAIRRGRRPNWRPSWS